MEFKVINSGSSGNGYAIATNDGILLIEAGCKLSDVKRTIDYNTIDIDGCLISHRHNDHSKYLHEFNSFGIKCYGCSELQPRGVNTIHPQKKVDVGRFSVVPFNLPHVDVENYGYIIKHKEIGTLLFMTDFEYCKYNFKKEKINHMMIECNYSNKFIDNDSANRSHVLNGHAELETVKRFIQANITPSLLNVCLLHLSSQNGDSVMFEKHIKKIVDRNVNVTTSIPGLTVNLSTTPF